MPRVQFAVASVLSLLSTVAWAEGFSVLGFEMGKTSPAQVIEAVGPKGKIHNSGTNPYSGGPMLKAEGAAFPVEGLNQVMFIFDPSEHLQAVVMKMDQARFDSVLNRLKAKYHVVTSDAPPVGNKVVRFHEGTTTIELSALHMSFEMNVRYVNDSLLAKFEADEKKAAAEKEKREASQF